MSAGTIETPNGLETVGSVRGDLRVARDAQIAEDSILARDFQDDSNVTLRFVLFGICGDSLVTLCFVSDDDGKDSSDMFINDNTLDYLVKMK